MSNRPANSRRAALQAQVEAEAKRKRTNRIMIVAASVVGAIILAIVGYSVVSSLSGSSSEKVTPPNATAEYGIKPYGSKAPADAPKVVIWEDFQCPMCKHTADAYAKLLEGLAAKDAITVEYRLVPMLDTRLPGEWSRKTARAAALADAYGVAPAFIDEIYANQPAKEGEGFSDKLLREEIPAKVGITGDKLAEFQKRYDGKATDDFVSGTWQQFSKEQIGGTPTILVNGNRIDLMRVENNQLFSVTELTEDALLAYLKKKA